MLDTFFKAVVYAASNTGLATHGPKVELLQDLSMPCGELESSRYLLLQVSYQPGCLSCKAAEVAVLG